MRLWICEEGVEAMDTIFGYSWEEIQQMQQKKARPRVIDTNSQKDYGAHPMGDGTFKMVPSGDIVDFEERCKRLK